MKHEFLTLESYTNECQNLTSIIVTVSVEEMFYLFSESNVAFKMAVSLPSPEALETGKAEGYLLGFSTFHKMELEKKSSLRICHLNVIYSINKMCLWSCLATYGKLAF